MSEQQQQQHPTRIKIKQTTTKTKTTEQETNNNTTTTRLKLRVKPPQPQQSNQTTSSHPTQQQINQIRSHGLQLWNQIVNSADSNGRVMSFQFMDLPSLFHYPDYYDIIKHPIALNLIKAKLDSEQDPYLSFEHLRSDLKRVFNNAKKYNLEDSEIFKDAKTLMKIVRKAPSPGNHDPNNHPAQSESSEPKQKKLKLNFKLGSTTPNLTANTTNSTPATVIIPPTPIDAFSSQNHPQSVRLESQTLSSTRQQEHQGMSQQEVARIQAELIAQNEARTKAREDARQVELRVQEQSRKQDEDRQNNLRQQAQAHQVQLRQQAQAQMLTPQGIESQPSQTTTSASIASQVQDPPNNSSKSTQPDQLQVQAPNPTQSQQVDTLATQNMYDQQSPPAQPNPTLPTPLSPSRSTTNKNNIIKLKLWFKVILENLESLTDRAGRKLIEEFLTLPDKARWKTYYQIIPEPIAFDNIQNRNNRLGYKEFEPFKQDVLKIFRNAQHFNEDGSMVWNDSKVLQAKFLELIRSPPPDLADLVLPHLTPLDLGVVDETRPVTPTNSMNGLGKRKTKTPSKQNPSASSLAAPTAIVPLRRSSRSPSRGSPINRLSSRPVSPLPRRVVSPGPTTTPGGNASRTDYSNDIIVPPQLPTSALTRSASRLANDISPALLSISSANHNLTSSTNYNAAFNHRQPATFTTGPRIRSLVPIPIKVSESQPPMLTRFKIISRPKTMENLKIMNQHVFQHAFQVPKMTRTIIIEGEINKSWPSNRQLRSSDRLTCMKKVGIEWIKIHGKFHTNFNPYNQSNQDFFNNNNINNNNGVKENNKETGLICIEVELMDGINVIEYSVIGKTNDTNNNNNNNTLISSNGYNTSLISTPNSLDNNNNGVTSIPVNPINSSTPPISTTIIGSTQPQPPPFKLVKESYRLFVYR